MFVAPWVNKPYVKKFNKEIVFTDLLNSSHFVCSCYGSKEIKYGNKNKQEKADLIFKNYVVVSIPFGPFLLAHFI